MRTIGIFLKITALTLAVAVAAVLAVSGYVALNKGELADRFLSALRERTDLAIEYSSFDISLTEHFPFAALSFDSLTVGISDRRGSTPLFSAQKLSLAVNSVNLIRGNFYIKSCFAETGEASYYPQKVDSLLSQFSQEKNAENSQAISINRFVIKDYFLNIYDTENKLTVKANLEKAAVFVNLGEDKLWLSLKAKLKSFNSESFRCNHPAEIQLLLDKVKEQCAIEKLELEANRVSVRAAGKLNLRSGEGVLRFSSNSFRIKNLQELLSINLNDLEINVKSKLSGIVNFNLIRLTIDNIVFNHISSGKLHINRKAVTINKLTGRTRLGGNFKNHSTSISGAYINFDNLSATLSARVKGVKNLAVLAEGAAELNDWQQPFWGRTAKIDARGNIKVLLSIAQAGEQVRVKYHGVRGSVDFGIDAIEGLERLSGIKGSVALVDGIAIASTGSIAGKPFKLGIAQDNFLAVLNDNAPLNPELRVDAEEIDLLHIAEIVSSNPKTTGAAPSNDRYRVVAHSKQLKYMNYDFRDVQCKMLFSNNVFEIQELVGNGFDGTLNGTMINHENKYFINTDFAGLNISKLFNHYDNFRQSIVTHSNISGNLSGSATLSFVSNDEGEIAVPSIKMEADVMVSDGKLMGMNKIEKLSRWLKLEQVKSIDFKSIRNRIEIHDGCVKIPKMDIFSNVLNMQLSGEHFFAGNFTYRMKVNFSQLLSRRFLNSPALAENEQTTDGSINLYLVLQGNSNSYEVKLDKKSSFEKIRANVKSEGETLKKLFREELSLITQKDTTPKPRVDSALVSKPKFNIEWDEYDDTLNIDNN